MTTHSPEETRQIGEKIAKQLKSGDVVLLYGDLGAGKSELTRGIAKGLGIKGNIPSPSFTILNVYSDGILPLYHFDWYRLHGSDELFEMGMDEYLSGDGIAVVEWPGICPEAVPEDCLKVSIASNGDDQREITLTPCGNFRQIEIEENNQ